GGGGEVAARPGGCGGGAGGGGCPEGGAVAGGGGFGGRLGGGRALARPSSSWCSTFPGLGVPRGGSTFPGSTTLPGGSAFPGEHDVLWKPDVPEGCQQQKGRQLSAFLITSHLLQQHRPDVAQQFAESAGELGGGGAVDGAVVVGQGQRQHQPRLEGLAIPDRLHGCPADAEDGHFRCVDDRREVGAADVPQTGDGEAGALHVVG